MRNFYVRKIEDLISEKELPTVILSFGMQRKKEILPCKNKKKQLESAAATILLQQLLVDSGYEKDELIKDEYGIPKLKYQKELFCSISHSGEYVACAISDKSIGIDIQEMREGKTEAISNRFFHENEKKIYEINRSLEIFYKIWTSKESYLKLTGIGLAGRMNSFYIDLDTYSLYLEQEGNVAKAFFETYDKYMFCMVYV